MSFTQFSECGGKCNILKISKRPDKWQNGRYVRNTTLEWESQHESYCVWEQLKKKKGGQRQTFEWRASDGRNGYIGPHTEDYYEDAYYDADWIAGFQYQDPEDVELEGVWADQSGNKMKIKCVGKE